MMKIARYTFATLALVVFLNSFAFADPSPMTDVVKDKQKEIEGKLEPIKSSSSGEVSESSTNIDNFLDFIRSLLT